MSQEVPSPGAERPCSDEVPEDAELEIEVEPSPNPHDSMIAEILASIQRVLSRSRE